MAISKNFDDIDHRSYPGLGQLSAVLNMQPCKILNNIGNLYVVFHRGLPWTFSNILAVGLWKFWSWEVCLINGSSGHDRNERTRDNFWKVKEHIIWYWYSKEESQWRCDFWLLTLVSKHELLQRWVPTVFPCPALTLWSVTCIGEVEAGCHLLWERVITEQKDT